MKLTDLRQLPIHSALANWHDGRQFMAAVVVEQDGQLAGCCNLEDSWLVAPALRQALTLRPAPWMHEVAGRMSEALDAGDPDRRSGFAFLLATREAALVVCGEPMNVEKMTRYWDHVASQGRPAKPSRVRRA